MSWQAYVDNNLVGTKNVSHAAIFGQDGGKWAISSSFNGKDFAENTNRAKFKICLTFTHQ